jgi:toxin-antitoxin system PIN domain toxin
VIAVDTNILVYAHREESVDNQRAYAALGELATARSRWAIPWPCVAEFLTVVTNHRIFDEPTPVVDALGQIDIWLESPSVVLLAEGPGAWPTMRSLVAESKATGPRVYDARIAAVCLTHAVRELWTAGRDYAWFPRLRTHNPLVGP